MKYLLAYFIHYIVLALSFTHIFVRIKATRLTQPQKIITVLSPSSSAAGAKAADPSNAPSFPAAAEIPFKVDRQLFEYVTEGRRNVVVFGP